MAVFSRCSLLFPILLLVSCAPREVPVDVRIARALPAVPVAAAGETDPVGSAAVDAADDPAIWRNSANPAASLVVGTDKKAGLHVYGLDGRSLHFVAAGLVNNVDLIDTDRGVIVIASDRNDPAQSHLALFRLDTAARRLDPIGRVNSGAGEAYGICIDKAASTATSLVLFAAIKDGTVRHIALDLTNDTKPAARIVRTMKLGTQIEGCVVDPRGTSLYVGEEDVGIWRFDAAPSGSVKGTMVAAIDGKALVADVEGLALVRQGDTNLLIASSQGDNAYTVFAVPADANAKLQRVGRFRIAAGRFGATSETDGIELALGDFGPRYPDGLFIAQDGENAPLAQNFKFVGWREIAGALGL